MYAHAGWAESGVSFLRLLFFLSLLPSRSVHGAAEEEAGCTRPHTKTTRGWDTMRQESRNGKGDKGKETD